MPEDIVRDLAATRRQLQAEYALLEKSLEKFEGDGQHMPMTSVIRESGAALDHPALCCAVFHDGSASLLRFLALLNTSLPSLPDLGTGKGFVQIADAGAGTVAGSSEQIRLELSTGKLTEYLVATDMTAFSTRPALGSYFFGRAQAALVLWNPDQATPDSCAAADQAASLYHFVQFVPLGTETTDETVIRRSLNQCFSRSLRGKYQVHVDASQTFPALLLDPNNPERIAIHLGKCCEAGSQNLKTILGELVGSLKEAEGKHGAYQLELARNNQREVLDGVKARLSELRDFARTQQETFDQMIRNDQTRKLRELSALESLDLKEIKSFAPLKTILLGLGLKDFTLESLDFRNNKVQFAKEFLVKMGEYILSTMANQYNEYRGYALETIVAIKETAGTLGRDYLNDEAALNIEEINLEGINFDFRPVDFISRYVLTIPNSRNFMALLANGRMLLAPLLGTVGVVSAFLTNTLSRDNPLVKTLGWGITIMTLVSAVGIPLIMLARSKAMDEMRIRADLYKSRDALISDVARVCQDLYRVMNEYLAREMKNWLVQLGKRMEQSLAGYQEVLADEGNRQKEVVRRKSNLNETRLKELQGLGRMVETSLRNIEKIESDLQRLERSFI